ncbi:uncharacterized protein LOC115428719 isoform X2 [Sphaeramia orbicularis]|uniref:uncharacterized protein LOC115428719 isoform X2 n=1 Tax=Sphaeramia orbicularis TaxID=375764 RepID=UPI00117C4C30|nr:uncharacterized protein LOC115428719 isoform X2 [Sphaeramia orbicularis]
MPKRCAHGTCKSDSRYPKSVEGGVVFYPFPKPKTQGDKCGIWIKQCGRPYSQLNPSKVNKNTFVCSKHFLMGKPTPEYPHPVSAVPVPGEQSTPLGARRKRLAESSEELDSALSSSSDNTKEPPIQHNGTESPHEVQHKLEEKTLKEKLTEQNQEMMKVKLEPEPEPESDVKNSQILLLEKELHNVHSAEDALTPETLNQSHLPAFFSYCTGFTYDQFNSLCEFFKVPTDPLSSQTQIPLTYTTTNPEIQKIPLRCQFFLTLMKLRQNFDNKDLAFTFHICLESVILLLDSWIDYMDDRLGQLSSWPHRDVILSNMPADFKQDFPNTFAILGCAELQIERPSSTQLQSQTDSMSTSMNTLKSLVACDPRGAVIYVSALFSGSMSYKEVFNHCKIAELLQSCLQCGFLKKGDGLMTDESFQIEKEVEEIGLKLNIPPSAGSDHQTPHPETEMNKKIPEHIAQVERAIAKIKKFKIISGTIPVSHLGNINQIWYVVSMLSNFQPHIIKEESI